MAYVLDKELPVCRGAEGRRCARPVTRRLYNRYHELVGYYCDLHVAEAWQVLQRAEDEELRRSFIAARGTELPREEG